MQCTQTAQIKQGRECHMHMHLGYVNFWAFSLPESMVIVLEGCHMYMYKVCFFSKNRQHRLSIAINDNSVLMKRDFYFLIQP